MDARLQAELDALLSEGQYINEQDPRVAALRQQLQTRGYSGGREGEIGRMRPGAVVGPQSDEASLEGFMTRYGDKPATDAEVGEYYGPGEYSAAPNRRTTPDQMRNQELMFGESRLVDEDTGEGMSTEEELEDVSRRINRPILGDRTDPRDVIDEAHMLQGRGGELAAGGGERSVPDHLLRGGENDGILTGDQAADEEYILGLMEDGEDVEGILQDFEELYGYRPEL